MWLILYESMMRVCNFRPVWNWLCGKLGWNFEYELCIHRMILAAIVIIMAGLKGNGRADMAPMYQYECDD